MICVPDMKGFFTSTMTATIRSYVTFISILILQLILYLYPIPRQWGKILASGSELDQILDPGIIKVRSKLGPWYHQITGNPLKEQVLKHLWLTGNQGERLMSQPSFEADIHNVLAANVVRCITRATTKRHIISLTSFHTKP